MTKTAKELREEVKVTFPIRMGNVDVDANEYVFTEDQLDAYEDQICREQRDLCVKSFPSHEHKNILLDILNASKPETK